MERQHQITRLEAFSDAVFAFALTLLVVSLEVPKSFGELSDLMRGFVPFGLTFAMICWIWYQHNLFFRRYGLDDVWTVTLNCFLLFVVLFYVYPMKFLATALFGGLLHLRDAPDLREGGAQIMLLYSTGVVLIFGSFVLLHWHAWRRRIALGLSARELVTLRFARRAHVISMTLGIVSIAVVLIWPNAPAIAGLLYALMGPLHGWNGHLGGKADARLAAADRGRGHDAQR